MILKALVAVIFNRKVFVIFRDWVNTLVILFFLTHRPQMGRPAKGFIYFFGPPANFLSWFLAGPLAHLKKLASNSTKRLYLFERECFMYLYASFSKEPSYQQQKHTPKNLLPQGKEKGQAAPQLVKLVVLIIGTFTSFGIST
jgi:hypothetical protein